MPVVEVVPGWPVEHATRDTSTGISTRRCIQFAPLVGVAGPTSYPTSRVVTSPVPGQACVGANGRLQATPVAVGGESCTRGAPRIKGAWEAHPVAPAGAKANAGGGGRHVEA